MQFIRDFDSLPQPWRGCVASIGNFDGVHLGHQAIFARLREVKATCGLPIVAVLFEPHPREFFSAATAPPRISTLRDKCILLQAQGVDIIVCCRFNASFAKIKASDFVKDKLIDQLQVKHLVVGDDFRFGYQRKGSFATLMKYAHAGYFQVEASQAICRDGQRVSSTRVRECINQADFNAVNELLGHPYQISGRVRQGDQRGREWGFPTINLAWPFREPSLHGIYATKVLGLADKPILGAASVGCRPTVDGLGWNIEVHLLDYANDCYGNMVTVQFLKWFREELCFNSIEALKQQIAVDVDNIRAYFASDSITERKKVEFHE